MSPTPLTRAGAAAVRSQRWFRDRFALGRPGLVLVAVAVAVVAAASTVLASVSEDVLTGDGIELRDAANLQAVVDHRSTWLVDVAGYATRIGTITLLVIAALLIGAVLWFRGARLAVAAAPLVSLLATGVVVAVVKQVVGRVRPPVGLRLLTETEPSFPSGHAADSAALFVAAGIVIAAVVFHRPLLRALTVAAGFAVSGLIGLSRLVLGVHWPTDVLAGWALGTVVAVAVTTTALLAVRATTTPRPGARRVVRARDRALEVGSRHRPARHAAVG